LGRQSSVGPWVAIPTATQRLLILPRSLHRPVASVEGNLTENLNKNAVRLWTDPSCRSSSGLKSPLSHDGRGEFMYSSPVAAMTPALFALASNLHPTGGSKPRSLVSRCLTLRPDYHARATKRQAARLRATRTTPASPVARSSRVPGSGVGSAKSYRALCKYKSSCPGYS
jgi:hypothetical protein